MRVGAEIMIEEINNHPTLLNGFEMKVVWQDGMCSKSVGTNLFMQNLFDKTYESFAPGVPLDQLDANKDGDIQTSEVDALTQIWTDATVTPDPVGLLGPACSGTSLNIASTAFYARMPLISPASTRPALSDRSQYPNFFRTIMPDTFFNAAWIAMCTSLGVTSITSVVGDTENWGSMGETLATVAAAQGVTMRGLDLTNEIPGFIGVQISSDSQAAAKEAAAEIFRLKERVVVLLIFAGRARLFLCEAHKVGIANAVYMVLGWFEHGWWAISGTDCTAEQLTSQAKYYISANFMFWRTDLDTKLTCSESMTAGQFIEEWFRRQGVDYGDMTFRDEGYSAALEAFTTADAACMYGQMLNEVLVTRGRSLSSLSERTSAAYTEIIDLLSNADFEGIQGRVRFSPGVAEPAGFVIVQQMQDGGVICDIASHSDPVLNLLGKCDLVFGYPGETFNAGPAGATTLTGNLAPYVSCPSHLNINMTTNECQDCPQGKVFLQAYGDCACRAGSALNASSGECTLCQPGTITNAPGSQVCASCDAGWFSAVEGASQCDTCPAGTYNDATAASTCYECPEYKTTASERSLNESYCDCEVGRFRRRDSTTCEPCLEGQSCGFGSAEGNFAVYGGNSLQVPMLEEGFYTLDSDPISVWECKTPELCPGGLPETCLGETDDFLCYRCPDNMFVSEDSDTGCKECSGLSSAFIPFAILLGFIFVTGVYYLSNDTLSVKASVSLTGSIGVGLCITVLQIFSILKDLNIPWPQSNGEYFSSMKVLLLDPESINMVCTLGVKSSTNYLMRVLSPFIMAVALCLCYFVSMVAGRFRWDHNKLFNTFCHIAQALFIAFMVIGVLPLECYLHPNGERSLTPYPEVVCGTSEHTPLLVFGFLMMTFFLVPFAAICLYGSYVAPAKLLVLDDPFPVRFRFLLYRFRPDVWWWGMVFLVRQSLLAFASSVPSHDPGGQILFTAITLVGYVAPMCYLWPWKNSALNRADLVSCMLLIFTLLVGTTFVDRSSNEDAYAILLTMLVIFKWLFIASMFGLVAWGARNGLAEEFERNKKPVHSLSVKLRQHAEAVVSYDNETLEFILTRMNAFDREALAKSIVTLEHAKLRSRSGSDLSTKIDEKAAEAGVVEVGAPADCGLGGLKVFAEVDEQRTGPALADELRAGADLADEVQCGDLAAESHVDPGIDLPKSAFRAQPPGLLWGPR